MKQSEVLQKLQNGGIIIVSEGLESTAQMGSKTIRYDTFLSLLKKGLITQRPSKNLSTLKYYILKK